jgi:phosphate transport system substrate-binding protein
MKTRILVFYSCTLFLSIIITSCNSRNENNVDQFTSGSYRFVFDESISPILDQELFVFKSSYPDAKPDVTYQPENKILNLILNDNARFAVMGRTLNAEEIKLLTNRSLPPKIGRIADDAIALIVAKNSTDSIMLLSDVKKLFLNNTKAGKNLVFDSPNSSIINYLQRISGTNQLNGKNIYALKNSKEVIRYVGTHQNAIGFISFSWLLEPDADYVSATNAVKVLGIKDDSKKNQVTNYIKPSQSALALNEYPLRRTIYVVDCTGKVGLGTGFASFLQSERGQKIILRSGLLPDSLPAREINIKKNL